MQEEIFEKYPIPKAYFKLALPVVFSMVISLVYNMVDTYFIAGTGNTDLVAGVALGSPIFTLMIALGDIFGLGGSSFISRLFGEKRYEDAKRISVFSFYGAIVSGVAVAAVLMIFRSLVLGLLGASEATWEYASQYYTCIALGAPFIIVALTPSNQLRTEGFATASMVGSVLGAVVNIILDPIMIFVLGWGAAGAATATVIGNVCTDIFFVWFLIKKSKNLSVDPRGFHISRSEIGAVFAIGIPASITNLMQSIGIALTNRALLGFGDDKVAAMGIVMKINMIAALVLVGFAFGGQPLTGYNYGARNRTRLKATLKFAYLLEGGMALVLMAVLGFFAPQMVKIFMSDPSVVENGALMLRLQLAGMLCMGIVLISTCTFQSAGQAMGAFLLSVSRQGVVFAVVLIRSFVAFRVSDGELVAVRIHRCSESYPPEFVIAFCRASQRVIHRAGLAAVCVNLLYSASQQVIDILCRIAFGVGNTKLIARKVIGVRGNAAERVCFGQQPSYLVVSVGGFVAFAVNLLYCCIEGIVLGLGFIAVCVRCDKQIANRVIGIGCLVACTVGFGLGSSSAS